MNTALIERQLAEHARRLEAIEEAITALCSLRPTVESIRRNVTQLNTWRAEIDAEDAKLGGAGPLPSQVDPTHARAVADVVRQMSVMIADGNTLRSVRLFLDDAEAAPPRIRRREFVSAAALLLAEIERLDRTAAAGRP